MLQYNLYLLQDKKYLAIQNVYICIINLRIKTGIIMRKEQKQTKWYLNTIMNNCQEMTKLN